MGLSEETIDGLRMAAAFHDIGKISLPAEILGRPAKLADMELSLVRTHARKGYEVLKEIDFPWPVARVVWQHHERMDGSGYPLGLSKDEILPEARILAVADVVEAMMSQRSYRPLPGPEKALEEIETQRGGPLRPSRRRCLPADLPGKGFPTHVVRQNNGGKRKNAMLIRCWGARGSIPVSGEQYLRYGGDTPCIEVRTADDDIVIIDAGSGIRRLGNRLLAEDRRDFTIIFTHAHWDHIMGFPFFKPIYRRGTRISLFGCPFAQDSVKKIISSIMSPPNFPVNFEDITAEIRYQESCRLSFEIGPLTITPIPLSHPNQGMGVPVRGGGKILRFF